MIYDAIAMVAIVFVVIVVTVTFAGCKPGAEGIYLGGLKMAGCGPVVK